MSAIGYFENNPTIAVATSGGADSMALLLLANDWAKAKNGRIISLTVNHNLRPEAIDEALQVNKWCKKYNIEHQILNWQHDPKGIGPIQENARNARYELMTKWCIENNILHLFLAHHADDQIETLFFRLARGSNLDGLSSMSAQTIVSGVRLLRPLLRVNKLRLIDTLKLADQAWIEDPSNQNTKYSRVHIRNLLLKTANEFEIKQRAGQIVSKFSYLRTLTDRNLVSQITDCISINSMGYAVIDIARFYTIEIKVMAKVLGQLIQTLSGEQHPPRSEKLLFLSTLIRGKNLSKKYSIGNLIFEILPGNKLIIYREGKFIQGSTPIAQLTPTLWDKRFLIEWDGNNIPDLEVRALGSKGLEHIKKHSPYLLKDMPPARIMRTLPSLWLLEQVVSVPHINYVNNNSGTNICSINIKFFPVKPLAGSSFFVMNMNT